jgi:hypothetical protein
MQLNRREAVVEFGGRVEREADEASEFFPASLAGPFDDVGRDRHRCADDLVPEGGVIGTADSGGDTICVQRQCVGFPPNLKLFEIAHALTWGTCLLRTVPCDVQCSQFVPRREKSVRSELPGWQLTY